MGNNLFKNTSPPPIITPGLITITLLIFLKDSFSDLYTAILLVESLSKSAPKPEKKMNCFNKLLDFNIFINFWLNLNIVLLKLPFFWSYVVFKLIHTSALFKTDLSLLSSNEE